VRAGADAEPDDVRSEEVRMSSVSAFMKTLESRAEAPPLRHLSGTIRFDLRGEGVVEPWTATFTDGTVSVSHRKRKADCVATMDEDLFDAMMRGEMNGVAATLRGEIEIEGDVALLLAFERLFPGPPGGVAPGVQITRRSG
jgi:putative sterol carrier protein